MRLYGIIIALAVSCSVLTANNKVEKYIEMYSAIAVEEMLHSGIPASITLAQGVLESGCGESDLALNSNNHFGIKCHKGWTGPTHHHKDDDLDANGNLIESCFRKYEDPLDSYRDHSRFLMNRNRYHFLFGYSRTDYKAWAKGLKKAGYATNPVYAEKLIGLIEKYNLNQYDEVEMVSISDDIIVKNKQRAKTENVSQNITPVITFVPNVEKPAKRNSRDEFQAAPIDPELLATANNAQPLSPKSKTTQTEKTKLGLLQSEPTPAATQKRSSDMEVFKVSPELEASMKGEVVNNTTLVTPTFEAETNEEDVIVYSEIKVKRVTTSGKNGFRTRNAPTRR